MFRTKIAAAAAFGILVAAAGMSLAVPAHAATTVPATQGSGDEFSYFGEYVNAWSGGPDIDGFNGRAANDDFSLVSDGGSITNLFLKATGGETTYYGDCVADIGNSESNPRAGLVNCSGVPWGSVVQEKFCSGDDIAIYVNRWKAYLAFTGSGNGSAMTLDGPMTCFAESAPF
jgi:hypothetical protein